MKTLLEIINSFAVEILHGYKQYFSPNSASFHPILAPIVAVVLCVLVAVHSFTDFYLTWIAPYFLNNYSSNKVTILPANVQNRAVHPTWGIFVQTPRRCRCVWKCSGHIPRAFERV